MKNFIEQVNLENNIIFKAKTSMLDIAKPLLNFHITHFSYQVSLSDGSIGYITTHPEFTKFSISQKYYKKTLHASPQAYPSGWLLAKTISPLKELLSHAKKYYQLNHWIIFINKQHSSCEFFYFASRLKDEGAINIYLNNLKKLDVFCQTFKERAKTLILKAETDAIRYHKTPPQTDKIIQTLHSAEKSLLTENDPIRNMTPREYECINYLCQGYTAKEIGKEIGISPRTVEKHVQHLKEKLNCKNQKKLIAELLQLSAGDL